MFNDRAFADGLRLLDLKQTGTTRQYISDFRAIVPGLGWNDAALKSRFYQGLSDKTKDIICLEDRSNSNTLKEYIQKAQAIDDRLLEREEEKRMTSRQKAY
ncbi:gag protein [Rhexocercosporidium sp. MPI-PUGE-AT-0058]|nr:gag protein [Rhexocercosporidium sp. MPI-PUGE-AT-0058]